MGWYEYRCPKCKHQWEDVVPAHKRKQVCPNCKKVRVDPLPSPFSHRYGRGGKP